MRASGLIHPRLALVVAELGHGDRICLADAGLPIPPGVERIDLAYRFGSPPFLDVLAALAEELVVEEFTVAEEAGSHCPSIVAALGDAFPDARRRAVSHEAFKAETIAVRAVIRTGEITPYANAMLHSGVPFG